MENMKIYAKNNILIVKNKSPIIVADDIVIHNPVTNRGSQKGFVRRQLCGRQKMYNKIFSLRSVAAIAALSLCGAALAAEQDTQPGQTVFKDAKTGKFRNPTAVEAKEFNDKRAADRAARIAASKDAGTRETGVVYMQSNGIQAVDFGEEHMAYTVVKRDAAGKLVNACVTGASAAHDAAHAHVHLPTATRGQTNETE